MNRNSTDIYAGLILLLVMVTAVLLRFWHFTDIPFTFDELSAMSRTVYDNFHDLVKYGVVEKDTHPAGVQVFMYYWTHGFGEAEWIVKLPFTLAGLASVWLAYAIARLWFHSTAALFTASYVASLQLFVMYSQIARPYVSGLFLTLMMVYFWSRYVLKGYKMTGLVFFVLFAAMSAYNHHFSLLFAAIVGISGLWFVKPEKRKQYVLAGVAIFLLYVPHLQVFFAQLQKGGIGGWLAKPSPWFLVQFLEWLFHYSLWVLTVLLGVLLLLHFASDKNHAPLSRKRVRWFMLIWFLFPVVIGYAYSVVFEPIIQYSLLIFSTPYLFMLLFSFFGPLKKKYLLPAVMLILTINTLTLVFTREYYKVFYKQPFEHVVKKALALEQKNPGEVMIIDNYVPYYTEYYFRKFGKTLPYFTVRNKNLSIPGFKTVLSGIKQNIVITSGLESNYFQLVKEQFPHWIGYEMGFTFEEYVLTKAGGEGDIKRPVLADIHFNGENNSWKFSSEEVCHDTVSDSYIYKVPLQTKYDLRFEQPLMDMVDDIYNFIDIEVEIKVNRLSPDAALVAELKEGKELIRWQAANFRDFGLTPDSWQKVYLTMDLQTAMKDRNRINPGILFRFYIWNKDGTSFEIKGVKIYRRPGNPYRYVLFTQTPQKSGY